MSRVQQTHDNIKKIIISKSKGIFYDFCGEYTSNNLYTLIMTDIQHCELCDRLLDVLYLYILHKIGDLLDKNYIRLCCYCKDFLKFTKNYLSIEKFDSCILQTTTPLYKHIISLSRMKKFLQKYPQYKEKLSTFIGD